MINEFIHWPKPYLISFANNILWNIVMDDWNLDETSFDKWHLLQYYKVIIPQELNKEWQILWGSHLVLVTLHRNLQLVLSKTIRIVDTKGPSSCALTKALSVIAKAYGYPNAPTRSCSGDFRVGFKVK
jgi:hypothetical protein